jgi:uncharacterized damage-inducible protein DinB
MNKQDFLARRKYFSMVHGVTVRAIGSFSDEELDYRPRADMRTPRELVFHIYSQERVLAEAARAGRFTMEAANRTNPEDKAGAAEMTTLVTVGDARRYAQASHEAAEKIFNEMSEDDLARPVESPMGTYPAWQYFVFAYDEHWHHRGQLYTYLRLLGKEPPMLYDYQ